MAERDASRMFGRLGATTLAAGLCVVAALVATAFTVWTVDRLHVPLPYWDEWYVISDFRKFADGSYGLADLARQHNEHRIFFPRFFFFADEMMFGLSGLLNISTTMLLQLGNVTILVALARRLVVRTDQRALLAGFVLLMLSTLRQEQNFTNGFQLQFVGVFTASLLAGVAYAAALDRLDHGWRRSAPLFAAAALCCSVSAYTMSNGVLAGPVLAVAAVLRRAPWPVPALTAALSAALAGLFFLGYEPGTSTYGAEAALAHLLAYPRYFTAYLGNPVGGGIRATQALGVVGLVLAAGAAWRVATDRSRDPASLALLILAGFVIATAAATAYGRIVSGTEQALESRYVTPSLLFWSAMVVFWFPIAFRHAGTRAPAVVLGGLMSLLGVTALWAEATAWPALAARSAALRRVSDSLLVGIYDAEAASVFEITSPGEIASFVPFLRAHRLAAFADPEFAGLGRTIGDRASPGTCDGTVSAKADPALGADGVRLSGRALDIALKRAPRRILVADRNGIVVGFGSASLPGEPSRLWTGYARGKPGDVLRAYARLGDGAPCALGDATVSTATPAF